VGAALKPHVSIIVPWRDRAELAKTLEANLRFIAEWQAELLIVNFGGDSQWLDGIVDQRDTRLRVIEVRVDRFNNGTGRRRRLGRIEKDRGVGIRGKEERSDRAVRQLLRTGVK
jgi:hypothetical protein